MILTNKLVCQKSYFKLLNYKEMWNEIKFKVYDKKKQNIYNVEQIDWKWQKIQVNTWEWLRNENKWDWKMVMDWERFTIIQYTGLKDRGWNEIYEWDILQFYEYKDTATVIFEYGTFAIKWTNPDKDIPPTQLLHWNNLHNIIWNIYENRNKL